MFSDKVVARDLRKLLQKVPASYISQVLLQQFDEYFSFGKIRYKNNKKKNYNNKTRLLPRNVRPVQRTNMRVDKNVYSLYIYLLIYLCEIRNEKMCFLGICLHSESDKGHVSRYVLHYSGIL